MFSFTTFRLPKPKLRLYLGLGERRRREFSVLGSVERWRREFSVLGNYVSEIIFPKLFFRKYFSEIIFPKIFFRKYFSENIFPKIFFRNYFSENIFPKIFFRSHFWIPIKNIVLKHSLYPRTSSPTKKPRKNQKIIFLKWFWLLQSMICLK